MRQRAVVVVLNINKPAYTHAVCWLETTEYRVYVRKVRYRLDNCLNDNFI